MTASEMKYLLNEHGLNVKMTAAALHVTPQCVYRWLNGTRKIPAIASYHLKSLLKQGGRVMISGDSWSVS